MIKAVIFDFYGVLNDGLAPNQPMLDYIKNNLKPKYKVGIISNAADDYMYQIVPKDELEKLFDSITISHEVGAAKPEAKIFEITLASLKVLPFEAVFIDDIQRYCEAAQSVGLKAIWYQTFEQTKAELEKILSVNGPNN